jgi:hypothetical protein
VRSRGKEGIVEEKRENWEQLRNRREEREICEEQREKGICEE